MHIINVSVRSLFNVVSISSFVRAYLLNYKIIKAAAVIIAKIWMDICSNVVLVIFIMYNRHGRTSSDLII